MRTIEQVQARRATMGGRVRELRAARGLTQRQLAALIDMNPQTISNMERSGGVSYGMAVRLGGVFGVDPATLVTSLF